MAFSGQVKDLLWPPPTVPYTINNPRILMAWIYYATECSQHRRTTPRQMRHAYRIVKPRRETGPFFKFVMCDIFCEAFRVCLVKDRMILVWKLCMKSNATTSRNTGRQDCGIVEPCYKSSSWIFWKGKIILMAVSTVIIRCLTEIISTFYHNWFRVI